MIVLHNFIESHRFRISNQLLIQIPRQVRAYARLPRGEMRQSVDYLLDGYLTFVASGSLTELQQSFDYLTRARIAQGFKLGDVQQALLLFIEVARPMLQAFCRDYGDSLADFEALMGQLERGVHRAVTLFADIFIAYMQSRIDEHNHYLQQQNQSLGLDLSKFILFRA